MAVDRGSDHHHCVDRAGGDPDHVGSVAHPMSDDYKPRTKREIIEKIENRLGTIGEICDQAGIGRRSFYQWRDEDPEFKKAIERAQKYVREDLIDEAIKRAMRSSDKLLIRLLEAYFPELFTQRRDLQVRGDLESLLANLPRGSAKPGPGTDPPLA